MEKRKENLTVGNKYDIKLLFIESKVKCSYECSELRVIRNASCHSVDIFALISASRFESQVSSRYGGAISKIDVLYETSFSIRILFCFILLYFLNICFL